MAIPLPQIFGNNQLLRITSGFGPRKAPTEGASTDHTGIDAAAPIGTPIKSLAAGKVIGKGRTAKSGNFITIDHGDGYVTSYSHLNKLPDLEKGSAVENGGYIGNVGRTGIATGPNVHVTLRKDGKAIDPTKIQDLETYIRPVVAKTETTSVAPQSTVSIEPRELLKTSQEPTAQTNYQKAENNITMAKPTTNSTTGQPYQKGERKVTTYATTGDMASNILGKGIGSLTAGEIMKMAMNQGFSERDARRAAKGLEKFQSLGGNAEMVFDPNSNRYNVLFKDGQDVRVDTRQGRRLGANVKVGAADLIGLGRDVNYLAEVVSRSRVKPEEPSNTEQKTETGVEETPKSQSFTPFIKMAEPTLSYPKMPTSERKFEEEIKSAYGVPDLLKPSDGDVNFFNPDVLDGSQSVEDYFTQRAVYPANSSMGYYGNVLLDKPGPKMEFNQKLYDKMIQFYEQMPNLSKEEAADLAFSELSNERQGQVGNAIVTAASVVGAGPAIRWARGVPGKIAKYFTKTPAAANAAASTATKTATTVVPKAPLQLNEAKITRMARERSTPYNPSSGPVRPMPQTQPRTQAKELLRLPQGQRPPQAPLTRQTTTLKPVPTKTQVRREFASDKYNKEKAAQERRNKAQVEYNIRRTKDASSRMAEEGGMHMKALGGKMSLPKYQTGDKFADPNKIGGKTDDYMNFLMAEDDNYVVPQDSKLLDEVTVTDKKVNLGEVGKIGQITTKPITNLVQGRVPGVAGVAGIYAKAGESPDKKPKFGLSDFQSVAKYAAPLTEIAAAKYLKKNIQKVPYTPIQARTGVVRDIPGRPSPVMRNVANRGSDLLTSGLVDLQGSAINRAAENQYNIANQQSRIGQEQQIMDRENQLAMMNARIKMATDQQNVQTANVVTGQMANAIRNVGLATQGNLANDATQRNILQGTREASLLGLMAQKPELFNQQQRQKMFSSVGLPTSKKGGKLKFKISK